MAIVVSGSLVYDHIMNFPDCFRNHILPDQIHILNLSFMVDRLEQSWGGTGGNIAHTMKLLGGEPRLVSAVGKDGGEYLAHFKKQGIACDHIAVDASAYTASAYITTDAEDNQITAFYAGPLAKAADVDIRAVLKPGAVAIISPTHKDAMIRHAHACATAGMKVVFDPGQQMTAFRDTELREMIERSEFVIGNDYEMKLLEDRTGWSMKDLLKAVKVVITTLGEQGSVVTTEEGVVQIAPCPPQSNDDPTGAGDAYRAGFFTGFELGYTLKTCGQMGSVAASYAIETYGTQTHMFTKQEFCERYERVYKEKIQL